jgi:hypothetical protein
MAVENPVIPAILRHDVCFSSRARLQHHVSCDDVTSDRDAINEKGGFNLGWMVQTSCREV